MMSFSAWRGFSTAVGLARLVVRGFITRHSSGGYATEASRERMEKAQKVDT